MKSQQLKALFSICVLAIAITSINCKTQIESLIEIDEQRIHDQYHDQMERELRILKRQNPNNLYERNSIQSSTSRATERRFLSSNFQDGFAQRKLDMMNETDPIKILESLKQEQQPHLHSSRCKTKNYNQKASHLYHNHRSQAELEKEHEQAFLFSDQEPNKQRQREAPLQTLEDLHDECIFGAAQSWRSKALSTFEQICKESDSNREDLSLNDSDFVRRLASVHINSRKIKSEHISNETHKIICGITQFKQTGQEVPYLCIDKKYQLPQKNIGNSQDLNLTKVNETNSFTKQSNIIVDL